MAAKINFLIIVITMILEMPCYGQQAALSQDSLLSLAEKYNELSSKQAYTDVDSTLHLASKAQFYAEKCGSNQQLTRAHFIKAIAHHVHGDFGKARVQYDSALQYESIDVDSTLLAQIWNNLGALYDRTDNYPKALVNYQKSLTYKLLQGNKSSGATTYNNLGIIKYKQEKYDDALQYYSEAIKITEDQDTAGLSRAYGNIGLVYIQTTAYDSALKYYDLSYRLLGDHADPCATMYATNGLADVYERLGDLDQAEEFANVSLQAGRLCSDPSITAGALVALGLIHQERGKLELAEQYWIEAFQISEDHNSISNLELISGYLHELYKKSGETVKALSYKEQQFLFKDSLFNSDLSSKITRLEMEYDFNREKDSLSFRFKSERAFLDAEIEKQSLIQMVGLIILILAILTIIFFARSYYLKKKSNQLLAEKNQLVSKSLKEKEFLMSEIHHRVKNNLQIVSSLLNIQEKLITDRESRIVIKDTKSRVLSMALVHENLEHAEEVTFVNAQEYLEDLLASIQETFDNKQNPIDFTLEIDAREIPSDIAVHLGLIVNEAITNSIKYAFSDSRHGQPTICISLKNLENYLLLSIVDNGAGFNFEKASESYGMKLMRTLTATMQGKLEILNGKGTTIKIQIPIE